MSLASISSTSSVNEIVIAKTPLTNDSSDDTVTAGGVASYTRDKVPEAVLPFVAASAANSPATDIATVPSAAGVTIMLYVLADWLLNDEPAPLTIEISSLMNPVTSSLKVKVTVNE